MESLFEFNHRLFELINGTWHCGFADAVLPFFRMKYYWAPFYAFIISFLVVNFKKKGLLVILLLIIGVSVTDYLSSGILKPWFQMQRPCQDPINLNTIRLLVSCPGSFSFPSSHASNHFMVAVYLSLFAGRKHWWAVVLLLLWAFSISYAQVYVGVHYPLDIIMGALVGVIIGSLFHEACMRLFHLPYFRNHSAEDNQ